MRRYKALYTTRLTQRDKRFQDGFVDIYDSSNLVKLLSENKEQLASAIFSDEVPLDGTDFRIEGYLVEIDSDQDFSNTSGNTDVTPIAKPTQASLRSYRQTMRPMKMKMKPPTETKEKQKSIDKYIKPTKQETVVQPNKTFVCREIPRSWNEILDFYRVT